MAKYCNFYIKGKNNLNTAQGLEAQLHSYIENSELNYKSHFNTSLKKYRPYNIVRT